MKPSLTNSPGPDRGPLQPHISTYLKRLEAQGYKQPTLRPDALLLADLDGWLARKGYRVGDLDERILERFLQHHMRRRHSRRQAKRAALGRLLTMLRSDGWVAPAKPPPPPSPTQQLLNAFQSYLRDERGFAKTTVAAYLTVARRLLLTTFGEGSVDLTRLEAALVVDFMPGLDQPRKHRAGKDVEDSAERSIRLCPALLLRWQCPSWVQIQKAQRLS